MADNETLLRTPLHDLHVQLGGKMVPFAGYEMPVQFEGVKTEHLWTRENAGLFDVSHMGPCILELTEGAGGGDDAHIKIAKMIEELVPSDIQNLKPGQARLTVLLNEEGGILDDLIITRLPDEADNGRLYIVVNGGAKWDDWDIFEKQFQGRATLTKDDYCFLVALQGPKAVDVLSELIRGCEDLTFMRAKPIVCDFGTPIVTRCGYTGEDGFEIYAEPELGLKLVSALLSDLRVKPIGLGARDSLRLEAGLCLNGHDMNPSISPIEADLGWVIQKRRREAADFPGAARILKERADGTDKVRVGIQPLERAPAREGTEIQINGEVIGIVTSGGFGPSVDKPVAMGYVATVHAAPGTKIDLMVRGKARAGEVCELPFVQPNYKR